MYLMLYVQCMMQCMVMFIPLPSMSTISTFPSLGVARPKCLKIHERSANLIRTAEKLQPTIHPCLEFWQLKSAQIPDVYRVKATFLMAYMNCTTETKHFAGG